MQVAKQNFIKGSVPGLFSIDSLRCIGAVVDYGRVKPFLFGLTPKKVKLQTTWTGRQILPLTRDFTQEATDLREPFLRLGLSSAE